MTTRFVTYARRVSAPREIAELTGYLVLKQENSLFRPRMGDTIINWGCTELPPLLRRPDITILNKVESVQAAVNKTRTFNYLRDAGVPVVENTTDLAVATGWYDRGKTVIQRNQVTGRQGEGIVICRNGVRPTSAGRLWTKYFDRKDEYRVHVMGGRVIDVQKKRLKTEVRDEIERQRQAGTYDGNVYRIRSYPNGWVFCRGGVVCPPSVSDAGIAAVAALGLDFGAVDIGYRRSDGSARVFEANTAPGIEGSTVEIYANGFRELCNNRT